MKSILDRSFKYTSSVETDLRKTFARIRREQAQFVEAAKKRGTEMHKAGELADVIRIGVKAKE